MNLLAFECSSPQASMAVIADGTSIAEVSWGTGQRRSHRLFDELDRLLEQAGIPLQQMDAFAWGRGPGNFTGMRISLATAQAMALPEGKPCLALSSGACLAAHWLTRQAGPLAVVGDARRGQCWFGVFNQSPVAGEAAAWALCTYEELPRRLPAGCTVISSEASRIEQSVPLLNEDRFQWLAENHYPSAACLGERAAGLLDAGLPGEELEPLYMHPAI